MDEPSERPQARLTRARALATMPRIAGPAPTAHAQSEVPFRRVLWAACGVLVVVMALFQVYDILRRLEIVVESTQLSSASLTRALAEQTHTAAAAVDVVLLDTAAVVRLAGRLRKEDRALRARLDARKSPIPQIETLLVVGPDGMPATSTGHATPAQGSLAQAEYFRVHEHSAESRLYVSPALMHPASGSPTVALSRRLENVRGEFLGVVVAYLDLDYFRRFYAAIATAEGSDVTLFRPDGGLVARYPERADGSFPDQALFANLLREGDGAAVLLPGPEDGKERIYCAQAVVGYPLAVGTSIAKSAVLAPWYVQAMHSTVRTTALCLSVIALTWLASRQLRRRERAEDSLRVQTAQLDELFDSAPEAIVLLDLEGRIRRVNREFTRLFGYTAPEALGKALVELIVPDELRDEASQRMRSIAMGSRTSAETERSGKSGEGLHVSELGAPILTASGQIGSYAIYRDITEQRLAEAERTKLESRLRQAEKLEAIGTMAGGIAHDFNNILAAILGYADMALNSAPAGSVLRRYTTNVMSAAHRARTLVDQILNYSRTTRAKRSAVDVAAVVEETADLVRVSLPEDIRLDLRIEAHAAAVIANPTQVHQLVMNLCRNAIHAMPGGGNLDLALKAVDVADDRPLSHGLLSAGRYLCLQVRDTGTGMEASVLERIFEPFFTTKESGAGTGLGLALVHGIVTDLGGSIDVQSAPGEGTTFLLYLPRSDAATLEAEPTETELPRGTGQRVLLVEDEKPLMLLAEEMLAALSYEPAGFTRPAEALAELRAHPDRFDAVALDHVMPGISGIELAKQLRAVRPDIPIVLISGYIGPLLEQQARAAGIDEILTKPLDLRDLAGAMSKALRQSVEQPS